MNTINKTEVVRARIEPKVKKNAESILKRLGVSHSTFINMSYRAVVETNGIPLSLHIPNKETAKVLKAAQNPIERKKYNKAKSVSDLVSQLNS
jgi:DNA-damage-inducible protein J